MFFTYLQSQKKRVFPFPFTKINRYLLKWRPVLLIKTVKIFQKQAFVSVLSFEETWGNRPQITVNEKE